MELSWINKTRLTLVLAWGILIVGILAWPLIDPGDPYALIRSQSLGLIGMLSLVVLAVFTGAVAYFLAWPFGREMGILAVPAGLAVWAMRSGVVSNVTQGTTSLAARVQFYHSLLLEPFYWMVVVLAGILGVRWAERCKAAPAFQFEQLHPTQRPRTKWQTALAVLLSLAVAHIGVTAFAQGPEITSGPVATQPHNAQIFFAVAMAFGLATFVIRAVLKMDHFWPLVSTALLYSLGVGLFIHSRAMRDVTSAFPGVCFVNPLLAILPIQIVAVGTLGAVAGYWCAIRYLYWRRHESGQ